jgi:general L-amino acid transport system ATP-binding protein
MTEQVKLEISDEIAIQIQNMNKWFGTFHVLRDMFSALQFVSPSQHP